MSWSEDIDIVRFAFSHLGVSVMAYNGSQLLPGQSAPLEVITATDQSGVILIVTALGLIFAIISLLIRIYLQYEIRHQISRDDAAVLLAMVGHKLKSTSSRYMMLTDF